MDHDQGGRFRSGRVRHWLRGVALVCLAWTTPEMGLAQPPTPRAAQLIHFDIAAQPLASALTAFGVQSQTPVIFAAADLKGLSTQGVVGDFSADAALDHLLRGTPLRAERSADGILRLTAPASSIPKLGALPIALPDTDAGAVDPAAIKDLSAPAPSALDDPAATITVVGTHIRGARPVGAPVVTITRDEIDRAGYANAQQIVSSLPQNFATGISEATPNITGAQGSNLNYDRGAQVNLRGLGAFSTLVLINGHRQTRSGYAGALFDISMIPVSAISRVEVLADGASAIYGADAIGGVVNFVLRDDFSGGETRLRGATVTDGDMTQTGLSHVQGWRWEGGHLLADIDYDRRTALRAADRQFFSDDLRPLGGPDLRVTFCAPGTITRGAVTIPIPDGQDGGSLTAAQLTPGAANRCDSKEGVDILPEQERVSVYVSGAQRLSDHVRVFAELSGAARWFEVRSPAIISTPITVPVSNAYYVNPFAGPAAPLSLNYSFIDDIGPPLTRGRSAVYSVLAGTEIELPHDWNLEAYASRSRSNGLSRAGDQVNTFYLGQALAASSRANAFNPFGDGADNAPAIVDAITGYSLFDYSNDFYNAAAHLDGALFSLPGGALRLSAGLEYRLEAFDDVQQTFLSTPAPVLSANLHSDRTVTAGFAELRAPIIGPDNQLVGIEALTVSLAARTERYSDFGETTNPKIGLTWTPLKGLDIRGAYGTAFRAPGFDDLRSDLQTALVLTLPDPTAPTGTTRVISRALNRTDIGPEKATLWSVGFDAAPVWFENLRLSATYFAIDYRDKIATSGVPTARFLIDPAVAPLVTRNPTQAQVDALVTSPYFFGAAPAPGSIGAIIDGRRQNLAAERQRGLDFDMRYTLQHDRDQFSASLTGAYLFSVRRQVTASAPIVDVVNTVNAPVDLRLRGALTWSRARFGASLFANYTAGYANIAVTPAEHVDSWTTFDAGVHYDLGPALSNTRVAVNVENLFDRDPPYMRNVFSASSLGAVGYDPQQASAIGRLVSLQLTKRW